MKQVLKYTGYILGLLVIGFLIWKFYYIIVWLLAAAVLSFMGEPLVRFFDSIHFRKIRIPHPVSALLSLLVIVLIMFGLVAIFVPLILNEADTISRIDVSKLAENLQEPMQWLDSRLHQFGVIPDGQSMQDFLIDKAKTVVNLGSLGAMAGKVISATGSIFVGLFSILFIAFFFLKDENMFQEGLFLVVPPQHHDKTRKVVEESKRLLVRYYIGVLLELLGVMTLITIGLTIFGIRNALLIGFFGGLMNIIPYLGPVIGTSIGVMLGITSALAAGTYGELFNIILKLVGVFVVANFIDNNILVPVIYSKSVKSHPLEIFLVIIVGGGIAGFLGMLMAVPTYTLLRVIAKEFFQEFRVVKKLTETIDRD